MKLCGAKILIDSLINQDVKHIFGYPGASILDIYDALYKSKKIKLHTLVDENGACHSADGYARASGEVGVVLATSGPGATNLVTGLATAYMDSIPLVAICGNVDLKNLGRDCFQEIDITGITMPITKNNYIVKSASDLPQIIDEAFYLASSGRKGPVLIDIPKNILEDKCDAPLFKPLKDVVKHKIDYSNLDTILEFIESSKRPFIYAGGGVISSNAEVPLKEFAEKIDAPVGLSMMGLGSFPATHKLYAGMLGIHGNNYSNVMLDSADLVIAVGARFSDRVASDRDEFALDAKIIHIDIDSAEINKNITTDTFICGDAKEILETILIKVKNKSNDTWTARLCRLKSLEPVEKNLATDIILKLPNIEREHIIATDVGNHQVLLAKTYPFTEPRTLLTSGGLGTMGYGLGASIGGYIATHKHIFLITSDGSFNMNMNELISAKKLAVSLTVIVFKNNLLGMVYDMQKNLYNGRIVETTLSSVDYVMIAKALGLDGFEVNRFEDIDIALKKALKSKTPYVIVVNSPYEKENNNG